ncbi:MAG: ADP-ribosylation factor-like protein [Promethearchaeota archaeon]
MEDQTIRIFIFGLGKAGKTTIVEYFREKKFIPQAPTIGVSISRLIFSKLILDITDVGGQELFRREWTSYLNKPHVLIFVIDGMDRDAARIKEGRKELMRILEVPRISNVPLLVLINKNDYTLAMSRKAAIDKYQLDGIRNRQVVIYDVSAKTGNNMISALNALTSMVLKDDAIEYFVSEEIREQSRRLKVNFKDFTQKGNNALKKKDYVGALANLNIAKELFSNLFQLGVIEDGKSYQKLTNLISHAERELEKAESTTQESSHLAMLRKSGSIIDTRGGGVGVGEGGDRKLSRLSIFLFGLDRAGKTTFVEYLKQERFKNQTPTLGLNISHLVLGNVRFEFNDLGGQKVFRLNWMDYWKEPDMMVFMVDAIDSARFREAKDAFWSILKREETRNKPLLILSNKVDDPEAKPAPMVKKALLVDEIRDRSFGFYEISVKNSYNIDKALNFMVSIILQDDQMDRFISNEMKRLIRSYKEMYRAYLKESKVLEKENEFQKARDRIHTAIFIQEELFKNGYSKAQKEIKKCTGLLKKLLKQHPP